MKKKLLCTIGIVLCFAFIVFSFVPMTQGARAFARTGSGGDIVRFDPTFEKLVFDDNDRFVYNAPLTNNPDLIGGSVPIAEVAIGVAQPLLRMQSRFYGAMTSYLVDVSYQVSADPSLPNYDQERPIRRLFSDEQMSNIINGNRDVTNIIVLDDTQEISNANHVNLLLVELLNVENIQQAWFTHERLVNNGTSYEYVTDRFELGTLDTSGILDMRGDFFDVTSVIPSAYDDEQANDFLRDIMLNTNRVGHIGMRHVNSMIGAFFEEGLYNFHFHTVVQGALRPVTTVIEFSFKIVHASNYQVLPSINTVSDVPCADLPGATQAAYSAPVFRRDARQYFFNFQGEEFPYIIFNNTRHSVDVTIASIGHLTMPVPVRIVDGEWTTLIFREVGQYHITATMGFVFAENFIPMPNFSIYTYNLTVFGYRAYFEEFTQAPNNAWSSSPIWLGGRECPIHTTSADITGIVNESVLTDVRQIVNVLNPVITNSPPVRLVGMGGFAINGLAHRSVVHFNDGRNGWEFLPFSSGMQFMQAGQYIVELEYNFDVANHGQRADTYRQVFYFEIVDLMDVRIRHYAREWNNVAEVWEYTDYQGTYHINQFIGRSIPISGSFVVYIHGMQPSRRPLPFFVAPRIELTITDFDGEILERFDANRPFNLEDLSALRTNNLPGVESTLDRYLEGHWNFRVVYGALGNSSVSFSVTVDNSMVQDFELVTNGSRFNPAMVGDNEISNFAVVGRGDAEVFDVGLEWGLKPSGLSFTDVWVDFFPFQHREDFIQSQDVSGLNELQSFVKSSYGMTGIDNDGSFLNGWPMRIEHRHDDFGTRIGYRLLNQDGLISSTGLYVIRIMDQGKNESVFVLLIDNTPLAFAQYEIEYAPDQINMATDNVSVGWGRNKLILAEGLEDILSFYLEYDDTMTLFEKLRDFTSNFLRVGTNEGFMIPINLVEHTVDVGDNSFNDIFRRSRGDNAVKHLTRNDEGFHIFRASDVLGNSVEYYIFVNHDRSRGIVLEHNSALITEIGGGLSPDAQIVRPNGITNRNFAFFSFLQRGLNSLEQQYFVERVDMSFYPMNFQTHLYEEIDGVITRTGINPNYPFASERTWNETFNALSDHDIFGAGRPTLDGIKYLRINHNPVTQEGIYVITRQFADLSQDDATRHYFFIVDRNPVIADPDDFGFRSDIRLELGSDASGNRKVATVDDFYVGNNRHLDPSNPNTIIETNSNAVLRMPVDMSAGYGTKYSRFIYEQIGSNWQQVRIGGYVMQIGRHHGITNTTGINSATGTTEFPSMRLNLQVQHRAAAEAEFITTDINENNVGPLNPIKEAGMYRLVFTDGSGGMRWQQFGMGARDIAATNRSEILLDVVGQGSLGHFTVYRGGAQSGERVMRNSLRLENTDELTFTYIRQDETSFFSDVTATQVFRHGQFVPDVTSAFVLQPDGSGGFFGNPNVDVSHTGPRGTREVRRYVLSNLWQGGSIGDDFDFEIRLHAMDRIGNPDIFRLHIDNTAPNLNLGRLRLQDTLWASGDFRDSATWSVLGFNEGRFIYTMPNDFRFRNGGGSNPEWQVQTIAFSEVNSSLVSVIGSAGRIEFGNLNESDIFADIVGLQSFQNRFFRIIEMDEAGNSTEYFVQLRGDDFVERIGVSGLVRENNLIAGGNLQTNNEEGNYGNFIVEGRVYGTSISVNNITDIDTNNQWATNFWVANPFFEISIELENGENFWFRRLGQVGSLRGARIAPGSVIQHYYESFAPGVGTETELRPEHLQRFLNELLVISRNNVVAIAVNNGFDGRNTNTRVFQIQHATIMPRLVTTQEGDNVRVTISNFDSSHMPSMFRNNANELFRITVQDMQDIQNGNMRIFNGIQNVVVQNGSFLIQGGARPAFEEELLVTLTDPFGRTVRTEYNGTFGDYFRFNFRGGVQTINGVHFTGDGRGVQLVYTSEVHEVTILRNGLAVLDEEWFGFCEITGLSELRISPPLDGESAEWQIIVRTFGSNEILFSQNFYFYTNLPEIQFNNLNGLAVWDSEAWFDGEIREASGSIEVSWNRFVSEFGFGATISYTRTFANPRFNPNEEHHPLFNPVTIQETRTIRRNQTSFRLTQVGSYVIEVRNDVWATRTYSFIILDVDNTTYKMFFTPSGENAQRRELEQSPRSFVVPGTLTRHALTTANTSVALGEIAGRQIPHYFVVGTNATVERVNQATIIGTQLQSIGVGLEIITSVNYLREVENQTNLGGIHFNAPVAWVDQGGVRVFIYALESQFGADRARIFVAVSAIIAQPNPLANAEISVNWTGGANLLREGRGVGGTPRPHYMLFAPQGNQLGLNFVLTAGLSTSGQPYNGHRNNIFRVDFDHNGTHAGTFFAREEDGVLTSDTVQISRADYGIFTFRISDWAGNVRTFTFSQDGVVTTLDYFTIINLMQPPVQVNGENVVDGMVFNGAVELSVLEDQLRFSDFFEFTDGVGNVTGMFVRSIQVFRNGVNIGEEPGLGATAGQTFYFYSEFGLGRQSFGPWTEPGSYQFIIEYVYTPIATSVRGIMTTFNLQIIDPNVPQTGFSFVLGPEIEITSIRNVFAGIEIINRFDHMQLRNLRLDETTGIGVFRITTRINNGFGEPRYHLFYVAIKEIPSINVITLRGANWGGSTQGRVEILYNPHQIRTLFQSDAILQIYRNGSTQGMPIVIDQNSSSNIYGPSFSGNGNYRVVLTLASGVTVFSDNFSITSGLNAMSIIMIIVGVSVVIVAIVLFFWMRNRMKVK